MEIQERIDFQGRLLTVDEQGLNQVITNVVSSLIG